MTLNQIANRIHELNARWWRDPKTHQQIDRNVGEILMLCVSELAEAMEGHRKGLQDDKLPHHKMFDVEIVDCFIRLFDIAGGYGIDLDEILEEKLQFNATRADHSDAARLSPGGKKY